MRNTREEPVGHDNITAITRMLGMAADDKISAICRQGLDCSAIGTTVAVKLVLSPPEFVSFVTNVHDLKLKQGCRSKRTAHLEIFWRVEPFLKPSKEVTCNEQ